MAVVTAGLMWKHFSIGLKIIERAKFYGTQGNYSPFEYVSAFSASSSSDP